MGEQQDPSPLPRSATVRAWLTTGELGERYHAPAETIRYWRHISYGPRGVKIGRRVLYAVDEVERWERDQQAAQVGNSDQPPLTPGKVAGLLGRGVPRPARRAGAGGTTCPPK